MTTLTDRINALKAALTLAETNLGSFITEANLRCSAIAKALIQLEQDIGDIGDNTPGVATKVIFHEGMPFVSKKN